MLLGWRSVACLLSSVLLLSSSLALAAYSVEVDAPAEVRPMLTEFLDLTRYQARSDISFEQLQFMVATAPEQVRQLLATEGYFSPITDATLKNSTGVSADAGHDADNTDRGQRVVHIQVDPGVRTSIAQVKLDLSGAAVQQQPFLESILRTNWSLPVGQPFRQGDWDQAKQAGLQRLQSARYASATIAQSEAQIDADENQAKLSVLYDSGPGFTLGALNISGTKRYPASIIENVNPVQPGEPYSVERLLELQRQIQNTPYFSNVIVGIDNDPQHAELAPINVRVTEFRTQRIRTGVGYATDTGAHVEAKYTHLNVLDRALVFDSQIKIEQQRQYAALNLALPPDSTGFVNSASASLDRTTLQGVDLRSERIGIKRARSTEKIDWAYTLDYYRDQLQQLDGATLPSGTVVQPGLHHALVPGFSWTRRAVDNPIFPRRGNVVAVQVGAALAGVLTDQTFVRAYGRVRQYVPVGVRDLMIFRSEVGAVLTKGSSAEVPASLLFRAGGTDSVRGYGYQAIGNTQNDTVFPTRFLFTASAEYQHWLNHDWGGAVFFDIGTAADNWANKTLYQGIGIGARWRSPVGPVNLDLAYAVQDQKLRPHISLGIAF
ncbi:MAG: autotransporter assembly complex family protein [Herbaspirillum sp.]